MVDLDSNPTKLIEIVEVGKQLLITRGALTTFSIANDVAKYFAILPAIFVATLRRARRGDRARSTTAQHHAPRHARVGDHLGDRLQRARDPAARPARAARRPLAAGGATALLRRNILIYGLGGVLAPFSGIKLIDLVVHNLLGA
jgi:K+-transporting ATPase ATPase B chain